MVCFVRGLLTSLTLHSVVVLASANHHVAHDHQSQESVKLEYDPVPLGVREYWMQQAMNALLEVVNSPCPFAAFGSVIVNHTGRAPGELGQLICIGANQVFETGNTMIHGETAAMLNCTNVLAAAPWKLSPAQIQASWKDLSLYTTAESCPMCSSAMTWGPFAEYIYASSMDTLNAFGWGQPPLSSREVIARSSAAGKIRIIGDVLHQKTDPLFGWQFVSNPCPVGCVSTGPNQCTFKATQSDEL